eukprot:7921019-Alexandrium_andersonii.AAC.1
MSSVQRSNGCWASRAATTATSSACACSTAFDRRTWAAASTPWSAVGAPLEHSPEHRRRWSSLGAR